MVEFKIRTEVEKVASLDAHNPDLYGHPVSSDQTIEVGGLNTPQKAMFRFSIADAPSYGAGVLKNTEFVFKAKDLVSDYTYDITTEVPSLNFYKIKDDLGLGASDWGGTGDISVVTKKIHQISGDNADFESIREDFSGTPYRESDLGFEPVSRHTMVTYEKPYQDMATLKNALDNGKWQTSKGGDATGMDAEGFMSRFGNDDPQLGRIITLASHETTSSGGGWWRTKKVGSEKKFLNKGAKDYILWGERGEVTTELYGDEVTPENSIFHVVRGDAEWLGTDGGTDGTAATDEDPTPLANGVVRFSTKKKKTGKQSMNMMTYWRAGNNAIHHAEYDTQQGSESIPDHIQTCMVGYYNLPFPEPIAPNTVNTKPLGAIDASTGAYTDTQCLYWPKLSLKINFEKLEKAHSLQGGSSSEDYHTHRRGVFIVFSNTKPEKGESWAQYTHRASHVAHTDGERIDDGTGPETYAGVFIRNSDIGIRMSDITYMKYETTGDYWYNNSYTDTYAGTSSNGEDRNNSSSSWFDTINYNRTGMTEDQWYNFDFLLSPTHDDLYLNVSDSTNEPVHQLYRGSYEEGLMRLQIAGINSGGARGDGGSDHRGDQYPCHFSIWVNNYPHVYEATSNKGTDWMIDDSGTFHDTLTSIYVDSISYTGINLNHSNATNAVENTERGRLVLQGGKTATGSSAGPAGTYREPHYTLNFEECQVPADWYLAFGCDNVTDWGRDGDATLTDADHRYIYWQDFEHLNNELPGPIGMPNVGAPIGHNANSVFSVGHSKWSDHYGRGGTSLASVALQDLSRTTLQEDIDAGTHQGLLSSHSAGKENTASEWETTQFSMYGLSNISTLAADETKLDPGYGKKFMINGFIKKGFSRLRLDTTAVISGHFLNSGTYVTTGASSSIKFNDMPIGTSGSATDFGQDGYHIRGSAWKSGINANVSDRDKVYFSSFDTSSEGDDGAMPAPLSRSTAYYAETKDNSNGAAEYYIVTDSTGDTNVEISSTSGSSDTCVVHGGQGVKHRKTECIFSSSKIIESLDPIIRTQTSLSRRDITLRVDTTIPLRSYRDTTFMLYIRDEGRNSPATGTQTYAATNKKITIVDNTTIIVHNWDGLGDDGSNFLLANHSKTTVRGITRLYISPEKYWIWMIGHTQGNTGSDYDDDTYVDDATGSPAGIFNARTRSYSGITLCKQYTDSGSTARSAAGVIGATYNESSANFNTYNGIEAPYVNKWRHDVIEKSDDNSSTILDLRDFGFGAVKMQESGAITGGHIGTTRVELGEVTTVKFPKMVEVGGMEPGDTLDFLIQQPHYENIPKTMSIISHSTTNDIKPHLLTVFEDELPTIEEFEVKANEDNPRYLDFTWSCKDDDLWYGFIMLDNKPITHQYHKSALHIPLNEDLSIGHDIADPTYGLQVTNLPESSDDRENAIMGYRYYDTDNITQPNTYQAIYGGGTYGKKLAADTTGYANSTTGAIKSKMTSIYDVNTGLAGHTKRFRNDSSGGVDIITNGSFASSSNWTATTGFTYDALADRFDYNDVNNGATLTQTLGTSLVKGNWYQLTYDLVAGGGSNADIAISGGVGDAEEYWIDNISAGAGSLKKGDSNIAALKGSYNIATSSSGSQTQTCGSGDGNSGAYNVFFMPSSNWDKIRFHAYTTSNGTWSIDDVSLRPVSNGSMLTFPSYAYGITNAQENALTQNYNYYARPLEQFSVVAHVTPLSWGTSATDYNWIIAESHVSDEDPDGFDYTEWGIYIDENGHVCVHQHYYDEWLPGYVAAGRRALKSKRQVPTDGTPINIIYTIDTELVSGNMKLYIDGELEDISGKINSDSTSGDSLVGWHKAETDIERVNAFQVGARLPYKNNSDSLYHALHIGCKSADAITYGRPFPEWHGLDNNKTRIGGFDGYMEEVVLYNTILYPVNPKNGTFTLTKPLPELQYGQDRADPLTWNAKLFVKDYHNIRGKTPKEVAQSGNVSWARTSFAIKTKENYATI